MRTRWTLTLAVLFTAAGAGLRAEEKPKLPADLALVSADGSGFLAVRVADVWNADSAAGLRKMAKDNADVVKMFGEMEKHLGLSLADVERLVVIFPPFDSSDQPVVVFTTTKPYDRAKVLAALVPEAKEQKIQGKAVYVSDKNRTAVYVLDDRSFLTGPPKEVLAFLERPAGKAEGVLSPALAAAAGKHALVLGLDTQGLGKQAKKEKVPDEAKPLLPLLEAQAGVAFLDVTKDGLAAEARLTFATEDAAKEGEKAAEAGFELARKQIPMLLAELGKVPGGGAGKVFADAATQLLKDIEVSSKAVKAQRDGKTLKAAGSVKTPDAATNLVLTVIGLFWAEPRQAQPPERVPPLDKASEPPG